MQKRLVLEDENGKVLRYYAWEGQAATVVRRGDTRRLEVVPTTEMLENKKIPFEKLGVLNQQEIEKTPFAVGGFGRLKLVTEIESTQLNMVTEKESERSWYTILSSTVLLCASIMAIIISMPDERSEEAKEELKQEVVKIVKSIPPKQARVDISASMSKDQPVKTSKKTATKSLKRMGALSALGSLSKSKQRGGLDLSAANTTAGPGLGGTEGSGGVQTSLYAKGVVGAALGVGGNVQGGGGYGTKGKGGGQAGYGKMQLAGSLGNSAIPLDHEATVDTGLERDMIKAVIDRNSGQVRFCYEQGLQANPGLKGRVAVGFTIGGNGLVKTAGIDSTTINSKTIEDCIVMRLRSWKFPLPQGGVDVKVSYPFVLRRAGQG